MKIIFIFVVLVNYIVNQKEIITAPIADAIIPSGVVGKPSACGAFNFIAMKLIPLSRGLFAQVDDWNYDWLMQWKWNAHKSKYSYYANRNTSRKDGPQKTIQMHRVIMDTPKGMTVDHRDHNGLNCLEENMRNCTHRQNTMNKRHVGRTTPYLGVYKYPGQTYKGKTYRDQILAKIRVNYKLINLGSFHSIEDAARAYNVAAVKYFGEFANLNIIE